MITNTELLFVKAKDFQDKRQELTEKYENELKRLEKYRGSAGYEDDVKRLRENHEAALKNLVDEFSPSFNSIFSGMIQNIGKRTMPAPTVDMVNTLNLLRMKKNISDEEYDRVAQSVKDNPIAVSIVEDIAHEHGKIKNYSYLCSEMSSERALNLVNGIKGEVSDFLRYDTTAGSRAAAHFVNEKYGTEGTLRKRPLFEDQAGFYKDFSGLEGKTLTLFSEAVDGE